MSSNNQFRTNKHHNPHKKSAKNDKPTGKKNDFQSSITSSNVAVRNPHHKVKTSYEIC